MTTAPLIDAIGSPVFQPDARCLADVELVLDGLLRHGEPLGGPVPPPGAAPGGAPTVTIRVPSATAHAAMQVGRLLLTDAESTPVAVLQDVRGSTVAPDAVQGRLLPGRDGEHGVGRELRMGRPAIAAALAGAPVDTVVVLGRPLLRDDLEVLERDPRAVVVVPVAGASPDGLPAANLLRMTRRDVEPLGARVLAAPIAWRDPDSGEALAHHVRAALGATDLVLLRAGAGFGAPGASAMDAGWTRVLAALRDGVQDLPEVVSENAVRELRRWQPPPPQRGLVVLFTGLSGSGKSTLARGLASHLQESGERSVSLLDGDVVRRLLSSGLTFSPEDRDLNVRRIGFVAAEVARHGGVAICAPIAPYRRSRAAVRAMAEEVGDFLLIHVSTPLDECESRDLKGLYARARAGAVPAFTGISDPYEEPTDADLVVDTSRLSRQEGVDRVLALLEAGGWLRSADHPGGTTWTSG